MKTGAIIFLAMISLNASAQTNIVTITNFVTITNYVTITNAAAKKKTPAAAPLANSGEQAALEKIKTQKTALEKRLADINAHFSTESERHRLKQQAKQISGVEYDNLWRATQAARKAQAGPIEQQLATLRLQEFEVRKYYKLK